MSKTDTNAASDGFIKKLIEEVDANLQNEQFSVEDLADRMSMSRSNLHRKVKQATGKSANQVIREYRLHRALETLKMHDKTVSEVSYEVGFGSPSYFTTCFTEYYGYPPGEVRRRLNDSGEVNVPMETEDLIVPRQNIWKRKKWVIGLVGFGLIITLIFYALLLTDVYPGPARPVEKSIAVLPFRNLNEDQENEYFSNGVVEAINRHLSIVADLRVLSITSTDRYRGSSKSARDIGRELKVSNLLEGSIQRRGNIIRLEVRLIDASSERQIWSQNYDRELKDIFKTQSEIANKVALALKASLSTKEKEVINHNATENSEAYDLYLKGKYEFRTYTRKGIHRATDLFKRSIELDSNYANAYSGLAMSYIVKAAIFGAELSTQDAMAIAKPSLDRALALDPNLTDAHIWNAFYLLYNNWDFAAAEDEYKIAAATNDPDALALYADYLNFVLKHEDALRISKLLDQTNPYYPNSRMILSLFFLKRYEEANKFAQLRLSFFNDNYYTLDNYGFLKLNTQQYRDAIQLFQRAMNIEGVRYPRMLGWMGAAYAGLGDKEKALALISELKSMKKKTNAGSLSFFIAVIYGALRDKDSTLIWINDSIKNHEMEVPWLQTEPQFYFLKSDPAFLDLVRQVGFPK